MPRVDVTLECAIERTARVVQLEGLFDVPVHEKSRLVLAFDAPLEERPWNIGLIVGPSGAGKSTVARALFADEIVSGYDWHEGRSIVDSFGEIPIRESTAALAAVGFSSPPSWLRPFRHLSNGEQFRATMARALLDPRDTVCVDEFSSVVDRTVAKIGSAAIAKSVRARQKRFVAATCHYDVLEWLQPDWVIEPHLGRFAWRSLQRRPGIEIEIVRCDHSAWLWFAPYHYLSAELHKSCRCFVGLIEGDPAVFGSFLHMPHPQARDLWSFNRVVVRPEFQGIGVATAPDGFVDSLAAVANAVGKRVIGHTGNPHFIRGLVRSPNWTMTRKPSFRNRAGVNAMAHATNQASVRRVAHFEYIGPPHADLELARRLWS